ncbi:glutamate 5-kinase [Desulfocurvus sp. DL9XJH121]
MDGRGQRSEVMRQAKRVVVKVGSAVLTGENGLDLRVVSRLADQMAGLHDRGVDLVLVSSGAVAAGRRVVPGDIDGMPARQAASAVGQSRLMHAYDEAFARYGKVSAQILLTRDDLKSRSRFLNALNTFRTLLKWRVIPVVNENDTVSVNELKFGDNDALASLVVNLVGADLMVNLTSADGVYEANPAQNPGARRLDVIENICDLDLDATCDGKTADGTGGMYSKLKAARRAAQLGVPTLILSGREFFGLQRAFDGEELGTWVVPDAKHISSRKFWMAYNNQPTGALVVDAGAASALAERGKSLLPAGIREVRGNFGAGALVRIQGPSGDLGVGLTNYKAADLKRIAGLKSSEIAGALGSCPYSEAVHRDNLLLHAAL